MRLLPTAVAILAFAMPLAGQQAAPTATPPTLAAAQKLTDDGHLDEALTMVQTLEHETPTPAGVERLHGRISYLKGDFEHADAAYAKAIAQDPKDLESVQMRGTTLFRMGKLEQAIPLLEKSHGQISGVNVDGTYVLALCYLRVQRLDDARREFATLYGFAPDSGAAWLLMARMLLRWDNSAGAVEAAKKAVALDPKLPEVHLILGQSAMAQAHRDEALEDFRQEIAVNPLYALAYERLGDVLIQMGKFKEAQQELNRAVLLQPNATGPFILLGEALLQQNDPAMAVTYLKQAEKMDASNALVHLKLGKAYQAMGDKPEAMREMKLAEDIQYPKR